MTKDRNVTARRPTTRGGVVEVVLEARPDDDIHALGDLIGTMLAECDPDRLTTGTELAEPVVDALIEAFPGRRFVVDASGRGFAGVQIEVYP